MSFNLSALNNQFHFNLPMDFVPEELEERYMKILKNWRKPYGSVIDYLNADIQDIGFPSLTLPTVTQTMKRGKETLWKGNQNIYDLFDKKASITFNSVDSNFNYMVIRDCLVHHYLNTDKTYDSNIVMTMVDENRKALFFFQYRSVIFTYQDGMKFMYQTGAVANKTFTVDFTFNYFDQEFVADKIDVIMNSTYGGHDLAKAIK